jgi:CRP-like cAMP-binding protein
MNEMAPNELLEFLRSTDLFENFGPTAMAGLADGVTFATIADSQALILQGELKQSLYIVVEGSLRLTLHNGTVASHVLYAGPGQTVSEMGIFCDDPAWVSAVAAGDVMVAELS